LSGSAEEEGIVQGQVAGAQPQRKTRQRPDQSEKDRNQYPIERCRLLQKDDQREALDWSFVVSYKAGLGLYTRRTAASYGKIHDL